jgi:divalent metal cation (Fe/Co/Zn/Cd) transporter
MGSNASVSRQGQWLQYATIAWNVVECVVAFVAASLAGSIALIGFASDSAIEVVCSLAAIWRLRSQDDPPERHRSEGRAHVLIGLSFLALAGYISYEAGAALREHRTTESSPIGIGLAAASLAVLPWLAARKRRIADDLRSGALHAERRQTQIALYLSVTLLLGLALNALAGWWWADPVAALLMVPVMLHEVWQAARHVPVLLRPGREPVRTRTVH